MLDPRQFSTDHSTDDKEVIYEFALFIFIYLQGYYKNIYSSVKFNIRLIGDFLIGRTSLFLKSLKSNTPFMANILEFTKDYDRYTKKSVEFF